MHIGFQTSCTFDYISRDFRSRLAILLLTIFGFLIPFVIIVLLYILIWNILKLKKPLQNQIVFKYEIAKIDQANSLYVCRTNENDDNEASQVKTFCLMKMDTKSNRMRQDDSVSNRRPNSVNERDDENVKSALVRPKMMFDLKTYRKYDFVSYKNLRSSFAHREAKVAKTILLIVTMFCLSWSPYVIVTIVAQFGANIEDYITPYTAALPALFAKSSSIFNPIIYTLTNNDCKMYFKRYVFGYLNKKKPVDKRIVLMNSNPTS